MAEARQTFTAETKASAEHCFAVITDFASYPNWSSIITSAEVVDTYPDGTARRVQFELDMKFKTVRYVLDYAYEPPRRVTWKLVEGDVEDVEGAYAFEPASGKTRVTCEQAVSLGFWIPGPLRRIAEQKALKDSVLEFIAEAERRKG